MMFFKRTLVPILVGVLMTGASTMAHAQVAKMSKGGARYQAAAQELVSLYKGAKDVKSAKATAKKIDAAQKRKDQASKAIEAAMQKLDSKNEKAGRLAAKIFGDMQNHHKGVADAQLESIKLIAAATAKAAMPHK